VSRRSDVLPIAGLVLLGVALFAVHLFGYGLFIGDSDRLNTLLNIRLFHAEGLRAGQLPAWSERMFMGMGLYGLHYVFPDAVTVVESLAPVTSLYWVAGLATCGLVILAAISAYAFVRDSDADPFGAFVAAALYVCSAYAVLRFSQVDSGVALLIHVPIILLVVRRIERGHTAACFLGLSALFVSAGLWTFLQEIIYVAALVAAYAGYRAARGRSMAPMLVTLAAAVVATVLISPRLVTIIEDLRLLTRGRFPWAPNPREVLRLLDDGVFGRYHEEARAFGNFLNLHEGLLLYTSTFATLLVLVALVRFGGHWRGLLASRAGELAFHGWFALGVVAALITPAGQLLVENVFLKAHLHHARLSVAALLPLCTVVGVLLTRLGTQVGPARMERPVWAAATGACGAAVVFGLLAVLPGRLLRLGVGPARPIAIGDRLSIPPAELVQVLLAVAMFAIVFSLALWTSRPTVRTAAVWALGSVMVFQAFFDAWFKIAGDYAWTYPIPFKQNNFFALRPDQLRIPDEPALARIRDRLQTDHFRVALICDPKTYAVFCSPHVAFLWRLRVVDGYVPGVPTRLGLLPWPEGVQSLRAISFPSADRLPWRLLALLNVKYSVVVNEALYFNQSPDHGDGARPEDLDIRENPATPVPRQFFAAFVRPVANAAAAARALMTPAGVRGAWDLVAESVAEGLAEPREFAAGGRLTASYEQDRVLIDVDPSPRARFLIVNELYHPRWHAYADRQELTVYPTNVVMRGVVVPAGASRIELRFVPFLLTGSAILLVGAGSVLVLGGWGMARRFDRR
jgi:hypothetical protein